MREEACSLQTSEVDGRKRSEAQRVGALVINSPLLPPLPPQVAALCYRLMDAHDDESVCTDKNELCTLCFRKGTFVKNFGKNHKLRINKLVLQKNKELLLEGSPRENTTVLTMAEMGDLVVTFVFPSF